MTTTQPTPADLLAYTPAQQRALDVFTSAKGYKPYNHLEVEAYRETFSCLTVSRQAALHTLDYYVCMSLFLRDKGVDGNGHDHLFSELSKRHEAASLLRLELTSVMDDYFDMKYMKSTVRDALHNTDISFRKEIRKTVCHELGTRLADNTTVDLAVYTPYKETEQ